MAADQANLLSAVARFLLRTEPG